MAQDLTHIARRSHGQPGQTAEAERMLHDIAFVLRMTEKVKQAMRAEPASVSGRSARREDRGALIPC